MRRETLETKITLLANYDVRSHVAIEIAEICIQDLHIKCSCKENFLVAKID